LRDARHARLLRAVGGFAEEIEVYYEDVDFCLAARAAASRSWWSRAPSSITTGPRLRRRAHAVAAFLKARNPWLVVRRHGGPATWLGFVPTYAAMVGASGALYALRGRADIVRGLARGAWAGARGRVAPVGAPARKG
jgi:hypothetical protein